MKLHWMRGDAHFALQPLLNDIREVLVMFKSQSPTYSLIHRIRMPVFLSLATLSLAPFISPRTFGQAAGAGQKAGSDVMVLANGDQLTGKLLGEANGTVTFHSDMAGDLTFPGTRSSPFARRRSLP